MNFGMKYKLWYSS